MELFQELSDVFLLKKLKIRTQTRKTLLKWAKNVKFEERRKKFHEALEPGKVLSKVGIVKQKGKRPDWTVSLEMLKTKDLRKAIEAFLKTLGLLDADPKNVEKLAKEKHWKDVLTLTKDGLKDESKDETKEGAGRRRPAYHPRFEHVEGQQTLRFPHRRRRRRRVSYIDIPDDDSYDELGPEHRPELEEDSENEELDVEPQGMRNDINELANRVEDLKYDYQAPFDEQQGLIDELKK